MSQLQNTQYKIFIQSILGAFILILGVTLILVWWKEMIGLIKGAVGICLAVGGMFMLYVLGKK